MEGVFASATEQETQENFRRPDGTLSIYHFHPALNAPCYRQAPLRGANPPAAAMSCSRSEACQSAP
jgi:hypothetical protein